MSINPTTNSFGLPPVKPISYEQPSLLSEIPAYFSSYATESPVIESNLGKQGFQNAVSHALRQIPSIDNSRGLIHDCLSQMNLLGISVSSETIPASTINEEGPLPVLVERVVTAAILSSVLKNDRATAQRVNGSLLQTTFTDLLLYTMYKTQTPETLLPQLWETFMRPNSLIQVTIEKNLSQLNKNASQEYFIFSAGFRAVYSAIIDLVYIYKVSNIRVPNPMLDRELGIDLFAYGDLSVLGDAWYAMQIKSSNKFPSLGVMHTDTSRMHRMMQSRFASLTPALIYHSQPVKNCNHIMQKFKNVKPTYKGGSND